MKGKKRSKAARVKKIQSHEFAVDADNIASAVMADFEPLHAMVSAMLDKLLEYATGQSEIKAALSEGPLPKSGRFTAALEWGCLQHSLSVLSRAAAVATTRAHDAMRLQIQTACLSEDETRKLRELLAKRLGAKAEPVDNRQSVV